MAQALHAGVALQMRNEVLHLAIDVARVVAAELDDVDAQRGTGRIRGKIFGDAAPGKVLHGQHQHLGVHGLDGQRLERQQRARIAQRVHEGRVAHIDQHRVSGDRQYLEFCLDHAAQRAFGAAQHAVEIETLVFLAQMGEVVAREAAVERRKLGGNQLGLGIGNAPRRAVDLAGASGLGAGGVELPGVQRQAVQPLAAQQHEVYGQHMVARLAVGAAALAAGVGVDHSAYGGAVGGRQLGREEQAMGLERGIELVLDHAGLHAHPALLGVDLQDAVHVARQIEHDAVGQRLAVGARAAAARREHHVAVRWLGQQPGDGLHILGMRGKDGGLWQALVDRVVGGQHRAAGVVAADLAFEAGGAQGGKKAAGRRVGGAVGQGKSFNHRGGLCAWPRNDVFNACVLRPGCRVSA